MTTPIITSVRHFVEDYFQRLQNGCFHYHNLDHTREVVEAAGIIGSESGLPEDDLEIVLIAAWLHDIGHFENNSCHEEASARIALDFLRSARFPDYKIKAVIGCIHATRIPPTPSNMVEKVICDADMAHLGSDYYFDKAEKLRLELSAFSGRSITQKDWMNENSLFFKMHEYFTSYAQVNLQPIKERNHRELLSRL